MSTRRRVGVSIATSETARRQLMQPVPCWERAWLTPEDVPAGSTLKVFKWVKTDKKQSFSDEEDEADEPLAPLPDEPEVNDAEEEMDQDDPAASAVTPDIVSRAVSEPPALPEDPQQTLVPHKPHPLSVSLAPPSPTLAIDADNGLDAELNSLDPGPIPSLEDPSILNPEEIVTLDMSALGPDGTQFEGTHDLTQLQAADVLLGGEAVDESIDPFEPPSLVDES